MSLIGGPTEAQLIESRLAALKEQDDARRLVLEEESRRLWAAVELEAEERAVSARKEARCGGGG